MRKLRWKSYTFSLYWSNNLLIFRCETYLYLWNWTLHLCRVHRQQRQKTKDFFLRKMGVVSILNHRVFRNEFTALRLSVYQLVQYIAFVTLYHNKIEAERWTTSKLLYKNNVMPSILIFQMISMLRIHDLTTDSADTPLPTCLFQLTTS